MEKNLLDIGEILEESGNFKNPWGITICCDVVFIVDSGNHRIQAFTCCGKFIFERKCEESSDMGSIIIDGNYAYVNDWGAKYIRKFEIMYD
jgi:NHL repeat.